MYYNFEKRKLLHEGHRKMCGNLFYILIYRVYYNNQQDIWSLTL